jgi:hypothetical protein
MKTMSKITVITLALTLAFTACSSPTDAAPTDNKAPANVGTLGGIAGNGKVTLTWLDPVDTDIDSIEITVAPSIAGSPFSVAKGVKTRVIEGLANGTLYTFTVKAVDTSGNKSSGVSTALRPDVADLNDKLPPGNVSALAAAPGDARITLTWTDPVD